MPRAALSSLASPLISLLIYSVGHGLLTTLLTLRLAEEQVSVTLIGLVSTAYFAGLMAGTFINSKLIVRVGHIRAYAAYASILCSLALLYGLFFSPGSWILFRLLGGFAAGGLFVVIESWIMVSSPVRLRGRLMALYMVLFYAAMVLGQLLLKQMDILELLPFVVAGLAASLSVIPLALSRVDMPRFERHEKLSIPTLIRLTPTAVFACFASGLTLSVAYGLLPLFFAKEGMANEDIADMVAFMILGGMCLQYPLGRLSDRFDRRLVLLGLFGAILAVSLVFMMFNTASNVGLASLMVACFGGVIFAVYPISLSQACDELNPSQVIAGNQGLLLCYSIGAMSGPILAPLFMNALGAKGMFIYFGTIAGLTVLFLIWRRAVRAPVPIEEHVAFSATTPNSPVMAELDPRSEALEPEENIEEEPDKLKV
ncbi:MFS transporter [Bowmanella dokdonensis]|uniref:MFS transporter n=1 Tax=Bowmanella dokdonensis TaxID=751969 RepID=A0A939IRF0_9ALTE|nr:MFS transporter [Bowmanella dokdonensis]MBN7825436.1 MFS transporter [Bowmanella dokdonensis]